MTPDRMFFYFRFFATVILEIFEALNGDPNDSGEELAARRRSFLPPWFPHMKPERIQVWLRQLGEFLIEVADGMAEEAGESAESDDGSAEEVAE